MMAVVVVVDELAVVDVHVAVDDGRWVNASVSYVDVGLDVLVDVFLFWAKVG